MTNANITARFLLSRGAFSLDVSGTFSSRGVTAIFGASGSGKTTLLRLLAGLDRAPGGSLSVAGECWQDQTHFLPTHLRPVGYVFQEANLFPHLNVQRNLAYGAKRVPLANRTFSVDAIIPMLGLENLLDRMPDRLSGGERQRVAMARALATSPRMLLLDEPLAALDQARKKEIFPYLERLHDELSIPVFYVSHAADEVARLADHLVVMEQGKIIANGSLGQVLANLDLPFPVGEEAGVVIQGTVAERDEPWHLARLDFPGGSLWARDHGLAVGHPVRIRVLARDVSVSQAKTTDTSILNSLPGTVDAIGKGGHPAQALVRILLGKETPILARLTHRSIASLGLAHGRECFVQIKTVALLE